MNKVGIRALGQHTSKIIRNVREENATYEVTLRGEVVARIDSMVEPPNQEEIEAYLKSRQELVDQSSKELPSGTSGVRAVQEQRRDF